MPIGVMETAKEMDRFGIPFTIINKAYKNFEKESIGKNVFKEARYSQMNGMDPLPTTYSPKSYGACTSNTKYLRNDSKLRHLRSDSLIDSRVLELSNENLDDRNINHDTSAFKIFDNVLEEKDKFNIRSVREAIASIVDSTFKKQLQLSTVNDIM